ncbi:MAG: hypothetical protein RQ899_08320 [Pseudomonadales bacterium]|nr:hypothetical protein [Pseudomonadales bacterium]
MNYKSIIYKLVFILGYLFPLSSLANYSSCYQEPSLLMHEAYNTAAEGSMQPQYTELWIYTVHTPSNAEDEFFVPKNPNGGLAGGHGYFGAQMFDQIEGQSALGGGNDDIDWDTWQPCSWYYS